MACENRNKATVTWTWEGEDEQNFETKKTPVSVTLTPISNSDNLYWAVKNAQGETIYTFTSASYNLFPNKSYERQTSPGNYLLEFVNSGGQLTSQTVFTQPVTVEPVNITGCRITIFDSTGEVFKEERNNKKCPIYKIKCDDDCHDGEMKCECNSYPGYCCIRCDEIKSEVNKAAATLRSIKS